MYWGELGESFSTQTFLKDKLKHSGDNAFFFDCVLGSYEAWISLLLFILVIYRKM